MAEVDVEAILAELRTGSPTPPRVAVDTDSTPPARQRLEGSELRAAIERDEVRTDQLAELVDEVERLALAIGGQPATASQLPGGTQLHEIAARIIARHTNHLAGEARQLDDVVRRTLLELRRLTDAQRLDDERDLSELLSAVDGRMAILRRLTTDAGAIADRVARLEAASEGR